MSASRRLPIPKHPKERGEWVELVFMAHAARLAYEERSVRTFSIRGLVPLALEGVCPHPQALCGWAVRMLRSKADRKVSAVAGR